MPEFIDDVEFEPKTREYAKGPRGPRPRTEAQMEWDEAFESAMHGRGFLAVQVAPGDAEAAKKRVLSSARYFDRAITEGEPRPGNEAGTVILSWKIRVPVKKGPRNKPAETSETPE